MQTKAYIALITKWYVTEIFSAALSPAEAPEVRIMTSANESLHCTDYEMVCSRIFSAVLPPAEASKVRVMTSQRVMTSHQK